MGCFAAILGLYTVPVAGHESHDPAALAAIAKDAGLPGIATAGVADALAQIARGRRWC